MHKLTGYYKPHVAKIFEKYRKYLNLTQAEFAELLAISERSYYDLKHANFMASMIELILLLKLLPDEEKLNLIHDLVALSESEEYAAYLCKIDFI